MKYTKEDFEKAIDQVYEFDGNFSARNSIAAEACYNLYKTGLIEWSKDLLEALKEAERALSHEYWMTGESASVIRAAIDKSPHIIKIRAAIKKATQLI